MTTENAISRILNDEKTSESFRPTLQVVNIKGLSAAGQATAQRYRLLLTDGKDRIQAMLATQKNDLVTSQQIREGTLVECLEFMTNTLQNTKIMILLNCIPGSTVPIMNGMGPPQNQNHPNQPQVQQQRPGYGQQGMQYAAQNHPNQPQVQQQRPGYGQQGMQYAAYGQPPMPHHMPPQVPTYGGPNTAHGASSTAPLPVPTYGQPQQSYGQPQPQNSVHAPAYNAPGPVYGQNQQNSAPVSAYGQSSAPAYIAPPQPNYTGYNQGGHPQGGHHQDIKPAPNTYASYGAANNSAPVVRSRGNDGEIMSINGLNPYQNNWMIKARITAKTDIRRWLNERGEGSLFKIDLLDSSGGEIGACFFKEAVDKFYHILEEGTK
jgi:replication factor A1